MSIGYRDAKGNYYTADQVHFLDVDTPSAGGQYYGYYVKGVGGHPVTEIKNDPEFSPHNTLAPCPFCGAIPVRARDTGVDIDCLRHPAADCILSYVFFSRDRWNTRAPCPIKDEGEEAGLIKLTERQEQLIKEWAADSPHGELFGNAEARDVNLHTFARQILGKPEPSPATTGKGPMELDAILDQIEERAEEAIANAIRDQRDARSDAPALVKALRRAVEMLEWHIGGTLPKRVAKYKNTLAQLLREPAESGRTDLELPEVKADNGETINRKALHPNVHEALEAIRVVRETVAESGMWFCARQLMRARMTLLDHLQRVPLGSTSVGRATDEQSAAPVTPNCSCELREDDDACPIHGDSASPASTQGAPTVAEFLKWLESKSGASWVATIEDVEHFLSSRPPALPLPLSEDPLNWRNL